MNSDRPRFQVINPTGGNRDYYTRVNRVFATEEESGGRLLATKPWSDGEYYELRIPKRTHPLISSERLSKYLSALIGQKDWDVVYLDQEAKESEETWEQISDQVDLIIRNERKIRNGCYILRLGCDRPSDAVCAGYTRGCWFRRGVDEEELIPFRYFILAVILALMIVYLFHLGRGRWRG